MKSLNPIDVGLLRALVLAVAQNDGDLLSLAIDALIARHGQNFHIAYANDDGFYMIGGLLRIIAGNLVASFAHGSEGWHIVDCRPVEQALEITA